MPKRPEQEDENKKKGSNEREVDLEKQEEIVYAFIDSQNLNKSIQNDVAHKGKKVYLGWKLDFGKFFVYLQDKYKVSKAFLFIGYIKEGDYILDRPN